MSNSSKYRFLSLLVIAVMSIALAACGGDSGNTSGGGSNPTLSNGDLLKQAAANMKAAKSYHIDISGSSSGTDIVLNGDLDVANNNSNLTVTSAGQTIQIVSIGSTTYMSSDGGKTFANAGSAGAGITSGMSQFTGMWNTFNGADVDKAASALKDGTPASDTINGTNCHHITASTKDLTSLSSTAGNGDGTVDIWPASDGSSICQVTVVTTDKNTNITMKWSKLNSIPPITAPPSSN